MKESKGKRDPLTDEKKVNWMWCEMNPKKKSVDGNETSRIMNKTKQFYVGQWKGKKYRKKNNTMRCKNKNL